MSYVRRQGDMVVERVVASWLLGQTDSKTELAIRRILYLTLEPHVCSARLAWVVSARSPPPSPTSEMPRCMLIARKFFSSVGMEAIPFPGAITSLRMDIKVPGPQSKYLYILDLPTSLGDSIATVPLGQVWPLGDVAHTVIVRHSEATARAKGQHRTEEWCA